MPTGSQELSESVTSMCLATSAHTLTYPHTFRSSAYIDAYAMLRLQSTSGRM